MSLLAQHGFMMARRSSGLADLIASLDPVTWLRLNDDGASSVVADNSATPAAGTLYSVINNASPVTKNTDLVSAPGLVGGDGDKAFNFGGNSMVESPRRSLSNAVGWVVFCLLRPDEAPAPASNTVAGVWQLTGNGSSVPELDIVHMPGDNFRFRVMRSGSAEVALGTPPTWPYGTRLAVAVKKEASGMVKLFADGAKVGESASAPVFAYGLEPFRWGSAMFGSSAPSSYYQFPGVLDELTVFDAPLSDAICQQLTAFG